MFRRHWQSAYRAAVLLALLASSLLYIHYLAPAESDFCGGTSGCEAVRNASQSYFFGSTFINVPLFGLIAYGVMFFLALRDPGEKRWGAIRTLAGVGGMAALLFIVAQALIIKAFCWLCMVVDTAAIAAAFFASAAHGAHSDQAESLPGWSWAGLFAGVIGLPLVWYVVRPLPPVPPLVQELYQPDKINVVEFADFQCPYCRRVHPMLKALMDEYPGRIAFKRLHMPLEIHATAAGAARVAVCAGKQGQELEMSDLLFEGRLGDEEYPKYVEHLKLDKAAFDACLADPATQAAIDKDIERFRNSGLRGLPTTFIGNEKITGARPLATFKEAFDKAAAQRHGFELGGVWFLVISALFAAGLIGGGRLAQKRAAS